MQTLHQQVTDALATIFGRHPHTVTFSGDTHHPEVTVAYQDFLTPRTLCGLLALVPELSVEWDIERTMSDSLRHQLLDELYHHPELLTSSQHCRFNVRFYVNDRFSTTDFVFANT